MTTRYPYYPNDPIYRYVVEARLSLGPNTAEERRGVPNRERTMRVTCVGVDSDDAVRDFMESTYNIMVRNRPGSKIMHVSVFPLRDAPQ